MRIRLVFLLLISLSKVGLTQPIDPLRRAGESTIMAFLLADSVRYVSLCHSSDPSYLVYRFGSAQHVEMEYPAKSDDSWFKFEYASYLRGGGAANAGLDLNYLTFTNGDWKYILYHEYQAAEDRVDFGVRAINLKSKQKRDFHGLAGTCHGSLHPLRDNTKVRKGQCPEDF